ncbi:MAG: nucleoside deaminase [Bacteroidetes bacterium]|nr:nucleoside deaminase [Bacteroidota bacterium]
MISDNPSSLLSKQSVDEHFMREALRQAQLAFEEDEIPVGAIVVWNNKIIARGHNQVERLNDSTAHAEMIAITAAFNELGSKYLPEATLYVTLEPCLMCCGAIFWGKIGRIVYSATDTKNGYHKYINPSIHPFHPKCEITSGILADEGAQLMKDFFSAKR